MGKRNDNAPPRYLLEAFSALRQDPNDDPPGTSFALTAIEVDGQLRWAIVAVIDDGRDVTYLPLFTALHPGARVTMAGIEGKSISDKPFN
jgi:hypothetical protein